MREEELVIKISEEKYNMIKSKMYCGIYDAEVYEAISNGTQLPKGHGRLIDADAFKRNVCTYQQTGCGDCKHTLCCPEDVPTIIEADGGDVE